MFQVLCLFAWWILLHIHFILSSRGGVRFSDCFMIDELQACIFFIFRHAGARKEELKEKQRERKKEKRKKIMTMI